MTFIRPFTVTLLVSALTGIGLPLQSAAAATDDAWRFEVLLDNKPIGYHDFRVANQGARQMLRTEASFDVKFLFITAFRYRHENTEIWNDGCLSSIDAATNNNGDMLAVNGEQLGESFKVLSESGEATLGRCVKTFAYWNPAILDANRLLNSQTGEYEDVAAVYEGEDQIIVDGEPVEASRYRLMAEAGDIKLWYSNDASRRWLALEAPAKGGRTLRYRPLTVPGGAQDELTARR